VDKRNNEWRSEEASSLEEARSLINRWRRRTLALGIALFLNVAAIVPFLQDHSLHAHFYRIGRPLLLLSMGLLPAFLFCAAQTYNFWVYLRDLKKAYANESPNS
jgi:hypothetical protein